MATVEEVGSLPFDERLALMERTAHNLAGALHGQAEGVLCRRPDAKNWAAKEIVCHLRDTEEVFMVRVETMLLADEPTFLATDPDRWAEERQYLRNDAAAALAAFRARRQESLDVFRKLATAERQKSCIHRALGRITIDQIVELMAWHDDNHLDQLKRALEGKV
jgi:DinB superfamily